MIVRLGLLIAVTACRYGGEFPCTQDTECRLGGVASTCETSGFCSVRDDTCNSGRRYDSTAGDDLAQTCVIGPDGCEAWQPHYFTSCRIAAPSGNLAIGAPGLFLYDTTTQTLRDGANNVIAQPSSVLDEDGTLAVVLSVQDFTVAANGQFRVIGDKPLIIAAWGMINVAGVVDVGSHNLAGAGSNPAHCAATAATAGATAGAVAGSGGGGGGGFGGSGGAGGPGASAAIIGGAGGAVIPMPTIVHGGCSGADSGNAGPAAQPPATSTSEGNGGAGGGAIVLSARLAITIGGSVVSPGQGGGGAPLGSECGGGGGGAGGFIALEAPSITATGTLAATGGGGGGGAVATSAGASGQDGLHYGANGGAMTACSSMGGPGSDELTNNGGAGGMTTSACGGGGGGGASGYTLAFTSSLDVLGLIQVPKIVENPF